jgi:carbon-monoxide dehydrogenase large subunit
LSTTVETRPGTRSTTRVFGTSVQRVEDRRLVTGSAQYVGNIDLPGALHVVFVRSQVAHAHLLSVDLRAALEMSGVVAGLSGEDLASSCKPIRADTTHPGWQGSEQWPLARGKVRFVGEPIAAVVAKSRYRAEDAADRVMVDVDQLPALASMTDALAAGAPILHEGWAGNWYVRRHVAGGNVADAFKNAERHLSLTVTMGRYSGIPMETRGCIASYNQADRLLTLWSSHQMPHVLRTSIARLIDFPEHRLRVIAPDVGGGFGVKSNIYPEEVVICLLALRLGRPMRWIEDRREHMLATAQARDHVHNLDVAYDRDGRIKGLRARVLADAGAYSLFPWTANMEPGTAISMLPGPYRIENYEAEGVAVATNKCPGGPYRGIARVPACFSIERALDEVAREVGIDPLEARRRNMVRSQDFPYHTSSGNIYDRGSYIESLDELEKVADLPELRKWQAAERALGRHIGIGIASFIEQTAHGVDEYVRRKVEMIFGYDTAVVRIDPSGHATVLVGIHSHGQGLETTLAQIAADELGIGFGDVRVIYGDTDSCPYGNGTFGSRSAVMCGGATQLACKALRTKLLDAAAFLMQVARDDLDLAGGRVFVRSRPESLMTVAELAHVIHLRPEKLPPGMEPTLESQATYSAEPGRGTYSNGAHLAVIELDIETGHVKILRYLAVDDCGRMINPMIVKGQIHGAICQGIGGAMFEDFAYDDAGNPLSTTFMDYLMPGSTDIPDIEVFHLETPSSFINGLKGVGESGSIAPSATLAAAVDDAIAPIGRCFVNQTPITPERVLAYIDQARATPKERARQEGP